MSLLGIANLNVTRGAQRVLDQVELRLLAGEMIALIGPNGAGKSTLLRVMAGLLQPQQGEVEYDDAPVSQLTRQRRAQLVGYHPQRPELHWPLSVEAIVALGRMPYRTPGAGAGTEDAAAISAALSTCGLTALRSRRADNLSGGELARVHLARLLAGRHRVLLVDEPIANLDPRFQLDILTALRAQAAAGAGVVVVLHDLNLAARFCDRLLLLDAGRVRAVGRPADVLTSARLAQVFGVPADYFFAAGIAQAVSSDRTNTAARAPELEI